MRHIREIAFGILVLCMAATAAQALTDEEQGQLDSLVEHAVNISEGAEVDGAMIVAQDGRLIKDEQACTYSRILNADVNCITSAIVFPNNRYGIDSIYYEAPAEAGYVNMDDWAEDVNSQIDEIWENYVEGSKAQSKRIGYEVTPVKWVQYPTLNKTAKVLTYGILIDFGGEQVINLTSVKFTRTGYVVMEIVTGDEMLAAQSKTYDNASVYASKTYAPKIGSRYADFRTGDKVAAIGAVGVLASVIGVKHGKGWLAGISAAILLLAKKFWFLLLVFPAAIWGGIKKFFGRT
jgi:uncharacterized membrane-anchored protein